MGNCVSAKSETKAKASKNYKNGTTNLNENTVPSDVAEDQTAQKQEIVEVQPSLEENNKQEEKEKSTVLKESPANDFVEIKNEEDFKKLIENGTTLVYVVPTSCNLINLKRFKCNLFNIS